MEDYASREDKLRQVSHSTLDTIEWVQIAANEYGDWLNHRSPEFGMWPVIGDKGKKDSSGIKFFHLSSAGVKTGRDNWCYGFSKEGLKDKISLLIGAYKNGVDGLKNWANGQGLTKLNYRDVDHFLRENPEYANRSVVSWNQSLMQCAARYEGIEFNHQHLVPSLYRPYSEQWIYCDRKLSERTYRIPSMFPTPEHKNVGFVVMAPRDAAIFAVLAVDLIPDLSFFTYTGQFFPRFTWEKVEPEDGGLFGAVSVDKREESKYGVIGEEIAGYVRVDNITEDIKKLYRDALGADITGDDIFHFVYGKLHDPGYRETYAADLKKMLPHIQTPATREEFNKFVVAGERLMELHVGYENVEPWPLTIDVSADADDRETWRVDKMKWKKRKDPETGKLVDDVTTLIYNQNVVISGIPEEADRYMLGARSAVAWLIDRYQVKKDKASGIVNDPNDWCDEVGNPRYIVDLIGKVVRVAIETVRIVDEL